MLQNTCCHFYLFFIDIQRIISAVPKATMPVIYILFVFLPYFYAVLLLMKKIRSLDGLRAISILLVILAHASDTMPRVLTDNLLFSVVLSNSQLGVRVFFVISGYLITTLLMAEKGKKGNVNLKHFYARRILRIFPPFYAYIIVIIILKVFFVPDIVNSYTAILFAALYLWNYKHLFPGGSLAYYDKGLWYLGHFWTLAMEEQFYIFWPVTFLKMRKRALIKLLIAILIIMPLLRVITYFAFTASRGQITMMLHTGGDTLLIGCLGALLEKTVKFQSWIRYMQHYYIILPVIAFLFIISPYLSLHYKGSYYLTLGISLDNICIFVFLFWCIYSNNAFTKLLNSKVFVTVGVLSYSLYIWQQLFIANYYNVWFVKFPVNIIVAFIVAAGSYYLIEKPVLRFKKKFKEI